MLITKGHSGAGVLAPGTGRRMPGPGEEAPSPGFRPPTGATWCWMVTPARFERTTCPLGGDRSIQLSYGARARIVAWPLRRAQAGRRAAGPAAGASNGGPRPVC